MFYIHPWEIDPAQPRVDTDWLTRIRHYNNIQKCKERLVRILDDFRFGTIETCIEENYGDTSDLESHRYNTA